jgi:excinuclease ABC subunit A
MPKRANLTILPSPEAIQVRGVRQNNLKALDLDLPLGKLCIVSGPSGSGKSSLAFDTLYAEGQRRYVETFSPYTRQFLDRMDKPKVDSIRGIPPAIAIEQSNPVKSTRSTVGTMTEVNDYLKLLLPRIATAHCPSCQRAIRPETAQSIAAHVLDECRGATVIITFGVPVPAKTEAADFFAFLKEQGYLRVRIGTEIFRTDEAPPGGRLPAVVEVVQDRTGVDPANQARLSEAIETALRFGKGRVSITRVDAQTSTPFSTGWHCAFCDVDITPPAPGLFSFNHPLGACPACRGFGRIITLDLQRAIPDRSLSLRRGAIKPFQTENGRECQRDLERAAAAREIDLDCPFQDLPKADQEWVVHGESRAAKGEELWQQGLWYGVRGFFDWLESRTYKMHVRVLLSRYRSYTLCPECHGGRYQPATLNFRFGGMTLPQIMARNIAELPPLFRAGTAEGDATTHMLREAVVSRLDYLCAVGLGYLSLDRPTRTLSGGEVARVNLTTCLGASLVNTLFVLDEPSIGLHPRDTGLLIAVLKSLRDKGNTLLVVEHEEAMIRAADHFIELGPGRGEEGGSLVYQGPLDALLDEPWRQRTLTSDYLCGRKSIPLPERRRSPRGWLRFRGVSEQNLKGIDVELPLGVLTCITGVSGSGKSTLVHDVIYRNLLEQKTGASEEPPGACAAIEGAGQIDQVVLVDQSPLSRTPRSSPALYLGVFDAIRDLFAQLPEAQGQGLKAGSFSFNSGDGRCERCSGCGFEKIEMQFLSDVFVRCPECEGRRYQPHILDLRLEGKSIHDVLELTVAAAITFFSGLNAPRIADPLRTLEEVGLGYLKLGQPLNVLSGGESQRLKLVERLHQRTEKNALLLLDEPTTGLHFDDIALLMRALDRLVERGHHVVVIEHNLEVIKCADHLIDLGPEGGPGGGEIVATGTPEQVAWDERSHTGRFLRSVLLAQAARDPAVVAIHAAEAPLPRRVAARVAKPVITIHGARQHNLKNVSLTIPRDEMVVITGLSGSGKSTLAFDLLFAEGQRRFLDSMSAYARQFVEQLEKPDVDLISGLPPSVAIEQRITRGGGKSTVATVTEVYHFLRLLYARLGTQFCPRCDVAVEKQSLSAALARADAIARRGRVVVLAPLVKARKGFHTEVAAWARQHGFDQLLVDGKFESTDCFPKLERFREHTIDVVVYTGGAGKELRQMTARALEIGKGTARVLDSRKHFHILSTEMSCPSCGTSFEELDPRLFSYNSPHGWCPECHGFGEKWKACVDPRLESALEIELDQERQHAALDEGESTPCPGCDGIRLSPVARHVRIAGTGIGHVVSQPASGALAWLSKLRFSGNEKIIASDILPEIRQRLEFLSQVGLDYLALNRSAKTLSGGEAQRIRLAAQLGSNLRGVLYVLDEPTIGLHARDNSRLLDTLDALRKKGNSLVIVEHDDETMRRADTIIDLGPGAGRHGGEVVAIGTLAQIRRAKNSATGRCLREPLQHPMRGGWRPLEDAPGWLELSGATIHNLKNVDVRIPLGRLCVITGVSGSGKSSLMRGALKPALEAALSRKRKPAQGLPKVRGFEAIGALYEVDQSPIGKTSRSTPATYLGVFDEIRKLYAQVPLARMRGYSASRFSFNTEGGRCETCAGQGVIKVEMNFLPTSYIPCSDCHGQRYNATTLEVLYQERSIGDVMAMTLEHAADFFRSQSRIHRPLKLLCDTGLGYLQLGQASPTLSGGEAQRLKLVSELTRGVGRGENARLRGSGAKPSVYLLEEPTIGLHMADVAQLLGVLHRLVDDGHTVIVIEHHLDLIAEADYIIDIGPEAGPAGGEIVAAGPVEAILRSRKSRTAPFLCELLV